jgi:hypothetical protein
MLSGLCGNDQPRSGRYRRLAPGASIEWIPNSLLTLDGPWIGLKCRMSLILRLCSNIPQSPVDSTDNCKASNVNTDIFEGGTTAPRRCRRSAITPRLHVSHLRMAKKLSPQTRTCRLRNSRTENGTRSQKPAGFSVMAFLINIESPRSNIEHPRRYPAVCVPLLSSICPHLVRARARMSSPCSKMTPIPMEGARCAK